MRYNQYMYESNEEANRKHAAKLAGDKAENIAAGQQAFSHRAQMNGLASAGRWTADLEKKAA